MFNQKLFFYLFCTLTFLSNKSTQNPLPKPTPQDLRERYGDALEAIFGVGKRLEALMEDPNSPNSKNFLVSPLSVSLLIAQMMLGAEGRFRDDLYNLLSLPASNEQKNTLITYFNKKKNSTFSLPYAKLHLQMGNLVKALEGNDVSRSFSLNCTNALFSSADLKLREEFRHHLQIYDTDVQALNFSRDPVGSQKIINDWASAQTNGVIRTILRRPLPRTASGVFTNAIYFKADWENPFSFELTYKGPFQAARGKLVEAEFMRGFFDRVQYGESAKLGCSLMALPYKNNELSMYFMLPYQDNGKEFDIRRFTQALKAADVVEAVRGMKAQAVTVQIPKMKLSNSLSILEPLRRYAVFVERFGNGSENGNRLDILDKRVDAFLSFNSTDGADLVLSGAAVGQDFKVTDVLQEVTLSVDEEGTEAAAVSAGIIDYIGGSKSFRADRPFVFFIRHEMTSATLFWGTIVDPTQQQ